MKCYHCRKARECFVFRKLYTMSNDFCINDCNYYEASFKDTYKKIAENDELMRLIYDYFTGQVEGYSDEEAKRAITSIMWDFR